MKYSFALFLLLLASCSHLTMTRGESSLTPGEPHEYEMDSFLLGAIPATKLPSASEICGESRVETVELNMSGSNVAAAIATIGIYVPHRVTVTCAKELN